MQFALQAREVGCPIPTTDVGEATSVVGRLGLALKVDD
jgi:hypothetical protein